MAQSPYATTPIGVVRQMALGDYATPAERTHYARMHGGADGTITEDRVPRLQRACWSILNLMLDGAWHTPDEIRDASGGLLSADRRRRDLRALGCQFEQRHDGGGLFRFRLVNADQLPIELVAHARRVAGRTPEGP